MKQRFRSFRGVRPVRLALLALLALAALSVPVYAKLSVFDSPHNLSVYGGRGRTSGRAGVKFTEEQQVCIFCHVPHRAMAGTPLWSRELPSEATPYQPYSESSTLNASPKPDKPTGASRLCLSCHDGTLALSKYARSPIKGDTYMPTDELEGGTPTQNARVNPNISTDLRDDHPVSFLYTEALAQKSHLASPSTLPGQVMLEKGANLECTACHDPHDNQFGNFLVMANGSDNPLDPNYMTGSPLCVTCHQPEGWNISTHNNITIPALGHQCLNCHTVHSAPGAIRLLSYAKMEDNCLQACHNDPGPGASSQNIKPLFEPNMHRHPIELHPGLPSQDHDEKEALPATEYHVQCVDCHNPHQVNATGGPLSNPPQINGRLKGVRKDSVGNYATTEFDICFKCHGGPYADRFYGKTEVMPDRVIPQPDQAKRFDSENPSFHPVTADRRSSGASLIAELQANLKRIYCTDCHNSDQSSKALKTGNGPNGPHGSQYPHILMARYDMPFAGATRDPYNNNNYSLCFRCHSADYVMVSGSAFAAATGNLHGLHVRDQQIPCFACHDPHGVSKERGGTTTGNAHLINFDKGYAATDTLTPVYTAVADGSGGSCMVKCHSTADRVRAYGSAAARRAFNLKRNLPGKLPALPR